MTARKDSWSVRTYKGDIEIDSLSMSIYCMYTSTSSCVDRLNTEGGRDSASWLMCGNSHLLFLKNASSKDYAQVMFGLRAGVAA